MIMAILQHASVWHLFMMTLSTLLIMSANGDQVRIDGDTYILSGTEVTYYVSLSNHYSPIVYFGYQFSIDNLLPKPVHEEVFSDTNAQWSHTFADVPPGSYQMTVQVYLYVINQRAWKVADKSITLEVRDTLDDFFTIDFQQDRLLPYTPPHIFIVDMPINISAKMQQNNTVLLDRTTKFTYNWTVKEPNTTIAQTGSSWTGNFTQEGEYNIELNITANISSYSLVKQGKVFTGVRFKSPITSVDIKGNNLIQDGSLLHLNITNCTGSPEYKTCHSFSSEKSNKSCFASGNVIVLQTCCTQIYRYFPNNGTQYVNIFIRNDVSEIVRNVKITIYKVVPSSSIYFVILPLVSSFFVIVIIALGIMHHIKQRRLLNATVEVATMENFGLYSFQSMNEMSFCGRIFYTLKGLFRCRRRRSLSRQQTNE